MSCNVLLEKRNREDLSDLHWKLLREYFRTDDIEFQRIETSEGIGAYEMNQQGASGIVLLGPANEDSCTETRLVLRVVDHPGFFVVLDAVHTMYKGAL